MATVKIPVPEKDGKHKLRNIIIYRDDHPLRKKMLERLLTEILEVEATEERMKAFDAVPYGLLIRPLLVKDCKNAGFSTLGVRYQLSNRVVKYSLVGI